jgi:hypothetical protein
MPVGTNLIIPLHTDVNFSIAEAGVAGGKANGSVRAVATP